MEEASEHMRPFLKTRESATDNGGEFALAAEAYAADGVVLDVLPDPLIGVEFR